MKTAAFWQTHPLQIVIPKKPNTLVPNYKMEMHLKKSINPKFNIICKGGDKSLKIEEIWAQRKQLADQGQLENMKR